MSATELSAYPAQPLEYLLARLPAHLLARDTEAGGLVRSLLGAVSGELALLETDLEDLYDAWFIETCADWVVPYLADLVGLDDLPTGLGREAGPRALVANTAAYRRRKGTIGVLEQVARDVTGWPARAVEFYRLLATSTHVNHVRTERPATASVRDASRAELSGLDLAGARSLTPGLDPLAHTAEVRRIASGRGRYGIPAVGVFLYPLRVYEIGAPGSPDTSEQPTRTAGGWSHARRRMSGDGYTFDPFRRESPLFAFPAGDESSGGIEHLAEEADLPVPLRPRRLLALLRAAREPNAAAGSLPLGIRIGKTGTDLPPQAVKVSGLEDLKSGPAVQVLVDPVAGTLTCYKNCAVYHPRGGVFVRYAYGGLADVGAGSHDRSATHETALAMDRCRAAGSGGERLLGQTSVRSGAPGPNDVATVADGLRAAEATWNTAGEATAAGSTYVVSIADSATYKEHGLEVSLPAGARLVLVAAGWPKGHSPHGEVHAPTPGEYTPEGVRPHLIGDLTIRGAEGSSVVLDGLALEGNLVVPSGRLGALSISQCTLTGRLRVDEGSAGGNGELQTRVIRSVLNGIGLSGTAPFVCLSASAVHGDVTGPAAHASFEGSTVRGDVTVRSLDGSSCVFDGTVIAEHRQTGCLRFSYSGPGSRTPRRYRCVPAAAGGVASGPVYASLDPGSPVYLALARGCPEAIRTGGESGAEMGVHHHLRRPLRVAAAARALAPYLPVQLEIGMCGS
ncbi:phage tail protein [Streptomyces sp. 5.8]|uniref:phage tail protein n=1 Tax=Streptomyces sp. 5.8 TaxID=3406571 RepID=UPI003BB49C44